jgi:hypothetical protein
MNLVEKEMSSLINVLSVLLRRFGAKEKVLYDFVNSYINGHEQLFMRAMTAYRGKLVKTQQRSAIKKRRPATTPKLYSTLH